MLGPLWGRASKFLRSAVLATLLLLFLGVWSMFSSVVPQGGGSDAAITKWAAAHPIAEQAARILGLHSAYSAPLFVLGVLVLAVSTALCAWERTKAAAKKASALARARAVDITSLKAKHDLEITCDSSTSTDDALSTAAETMKHLGLNPVRDGGMLRAVSPSWAVWGSPVFHWALLLLMLTLVSGNLLRAEGLMGVAVGETKPDQPSSYGVVHSGPFFYWHQITRSIRVDAFEPHYRSGGVDRGPTPTVSVLDRSGHVIKQQRVYPNATLKTGSLTIYPSDYGLAVNVSVVNTAGAAVYHQSLLNDFASSAPSGTITNDFLGVSDSQGKLTYRVIATIPLDSQGGTFVNDVPTKQVATLQLTKADGTVVGSKDVRPGETLQLPNGALLRLDNLSYYARLQLVDDWSIPVLYLGLVVAIVGLGGAVLARQYIVLAGVVTDSEGTKLLVRLRLWRNVSTSREETEDELTRVLGRPEEESAS